LNGSNTKNIFRDGRKGGWEGEVVPITMPTTTSRKWWRPSRTRLKLIHRAITMKKMTNTNFHKWERLSYNFIFALTYMARNTHMATTPAAWPEGKACFARIRSALSQVHISSPQYTRGAPGNAINGVPKIRKWNKREGEEKNQKRSEGREKERKRARHISSRHV
jgi:hypothetical protein